MKTLPSLAGFVGASGKPICVDGSSPSFKAKPRPANAGQASYHKGFVVEGFRPAVVAEAERLAADELHRWASLSDDERVKAERKGARAPKAWDLERHLAEAKPTRINRKPYGSPSAADACAALAGKEGWLGVRVVPLSKGDVPPAQTELL